MEVRCQLHTLVPTGQNAAWVPGPRASRCFREEKVFSPCQQQNPDSFRCPAHCQLTVVAQSARVCAVNKMVCAVNKKVCAVNKKVCAVNKVCAINKMVCAVNKMVCAVNKMVHTVQKVRNTA